MAQPQKKTVLRVKRKYADIESIETIGMNYPYYNDFLVCIIGDETFIDESLH